MRILQTAGEALTKEGIMAYNCGFLDMDSPYAFCEQFYGLMCGAGIGFSVESDVVAKLPKVPDNLDDLSYTHQVEDTRLGWVLALEECLIRGFRGELINFDGSKVRKKGSRLKTMGGYASGYEPLEKLLLYARNLFIKTQGRQWTTLECHDLCVMIESVVVSGGIRRSSGISFSDLNDEAMRTAKSGDWYIENPNRAFANNSAVYFGRPDYATFLLEWDNLANSGSGERGICNERSFEKQARKYQRRIVKRRRTNPCGEISLLSKQFCNLSQVNIFPYDTENSIIEKQKISAFFGTVQATITNFGYISKQWKENCEAERLLGCSLSGVCDNPLTYTLNDNLFKFQNKLREVAVNTNKYWSNVFGINPSVAVTTMKPAGNSGQAAFTASGLHRWLYKFFYRTVRLQSFDPVGHFLKDHGVYWEQDKFSMLTDVFYFPLRSPEGSLLQEDCSAIDQLMLWKSYHDNYTEHNPSCTIYVKKHEWDMVRNWVWENFDDISGLSFLPATEHAYTQAPYIQLSEQEYEKAVLNFPKNIDFSNLKNYEKEDTTNTEKERQCSGINCEL